ncbi:MAG: MATE family efflux transporter [Bacteroidaceae bacterium]|nr:MATE family efflux transporter [Bacteroidaceae bacterium]
MTQPSDNKRATLELGTKPVGRLLLQYALPAIIAMTASSLYNMVDSIFIGQGVGPLAISGLAITFPFMNISAAFGAAIGVGASTCLSVRLGQRDYSTAQRILGNTLMLNLIIGIVFAAVALIFLDPILIFFGATDNTIGYAREYMVIILLGNVITHQYFGLNAVLRAASKPRMAMYATIFTVVVNTLLDPIFIYLLDMGIRGAAIATILSQMLALCWQLKIFSNRNELLHFERGGLRLNGQIVKNIIGIGISPFSMNACACLIVIFINTALVRHGGDLAVGAYGIANRIGFFFFMVVMGINQGMQPITGYNYGAERYDRMLHVLRLSIISGISAMTIGWLVSELLPYPCVCLFTRHEELRQIAVHGIRINSIVFPLIGFQAVVTNFFQSIGKAKVSIFLSLSRQLLFLLPLLVVLPPLLGVDGVWWSLPASDLLSFIVTFIIMARYMRQFRRHHSILKHTNTQS